LVKAMSDPSTPLATKHLVPLRDVERELLIQMKALQGRGAAPVQRARMANLVIFCDTLEQSVEIIGQVPDINAVHPARTILLVGEPGSARDVTARVTVRPLRIGAKSYACAELVTLHAGGPTVERFPFAVRSLVIGDLPTNLWWAAATPPPLAGALLYELSEHAQQIVYDSRGWPDPLRGVAATGAWLEGVERGGTQGGRWRVASDLNWRRLKYWRRLVMQALDEGSAPGAAASVTDVLIEHGPHAMVQAWELGSWLSRQLGWRLVGGKTQSGTEVHWRFTSAKEHPLLRVRRLDQGPPEVRLVRIACNLDGKPIALRLAAEDGQRLSITLEGVDAAPRTMALPGHSAVELIGRQLSDRERDPAFRESMAVAQAMAQSVIG
jgi:glucose-6-phosphate dehydrogenase assembly protein OpcA